MTNSPSTHLLRFWLAPVTGFVVGLLALLLASLIDLITTDLQFADLAPHWLEYLCAGVAFAVCSLRPFRAALTQQNDDLAWVKRSLFAGTAAIAIFLPAMLLIDAKFPIRWLLYTYALSILFDWLAARFVLRDSFSAPPLSPRAIRLAAYFDEMPHAPFVIAGLFLLALTPVYLLFNLQTPAERLGNWAFGFLVVGVGVALIDLLVPPQVRVWNRHLPAVGIAVMLVAFFGTGYLSESSHTTPEAAYLVDVQPSYLSIHVTNRDIILSDSPKLRLGNIPNMSAYLDLLPDQRGLALWDDLTRALQDKHMAYWVNVVEDSHDTQGILAAYLKTNGCLDDIPGTILPVKPYELRAPLASPKVLPPTIASRVTDAFDAAQVDFGAIQMTGFKFEPKVCSHDAVAVALRWRLVQRTQEPIRVSVFLMDAKGRQIQSQDFSIEDLQKHTTDQLPDGTQMSGYHLLVVPFGTPPGQYTLAAGVYPASGSQRLHVNNASGVPASSSDFVALGQVQVYRAEDYKADPFKSLQDSNLVQAKVELREGLRLAAYGLNTQSVLPGENVSMTARWRALLDSLPSYTVRVRLKQGDRVVAETSGVPADGTYPTNQWRADEVVVDRWDLRVPPDAAGGQAQLEIGIDGGKSIYVADVNIAVVTHTFQIPSMRYPAAATFSGIGDLIGYDLDRTQVSSDEPLALTLFWRAGTPAIDKNYTVFAQLLATDGHLIAQSDSMPAEGQRPTRGWVNGEIVADRHELNLTDKAYQGNATLIVGIYDSASFARVPVKGSPDNFVMLPTAVQVIAR